MLDEMGDDQFKLAFSRARTPMDLCDPDEVRLFTTYSLLLTLYYLLFTTYSLLLTLYYLLFNTCSLLLTLYYLLFTTY